MDQQTYEREKALYLYIAGLERGDFDQMQRILEQAQTDPALEKMIDEAHEVYMEEEDLQTLSEEQIASMRATVARVTAERKEKKNG